MTAPHPKIRRQRGSLLIATMLIAAVIGLGLTGYIVLSRNALKLAHRSLFMQDALNLAEAGLESALYCFSQLQGVSTPTSIQAVWSGWTISSGTNVATRTLPSFNRDQNAVGVVKIYVKGCDGSDPDPCVIAQATITPFDGSPPIVKIIEANFGKNSYFTNGLVATGGSAPSSNTTYISISGPVTADSYKSGGTKKFTTTNQLTGNFSVGLAAGRISVSSGKTLGINGDLYVSSASTSVPSSVTYSGTRYNDFKSVFPMPAFPEYSAGTPVFTDPRRGRRRRSRTNNALAETLPRSGDVAAEDGRYYYFCNSATIRNLTVQPNKKVTIVGTNTKIDIGNSGRLRINSGASCEFFVDGTINVSGTIDSGDWAGALRFYSSTADDCTIDTKITSANVYLCVYAPLADLRFRALNDTTQDTIVGSFVGRSIAISQRMRFIYDESLATEDSGRVWTLNAWSEISERADRDLLPARTGNFLP